ncbi:MAG: UDP-N-acetylmuramate--L-alanine ligase [Gammaproteobacteria bacterium]|nr:UDP-N-acetylmuramate--L-alanine ligase [Gammaproteobacteria bacterium]MCH9744738.1 UDP-N-acetylmuramate--L-alanine ligase [Gammaproteobacteria bacterium]
MKKVLLIAGGTGGHIFPALSVADKLTAINIKVEWLGSHVGMEKKIIGDRYPMHLVSIKAIRGRGIIKRAVGLLLSLSAVIQSLYYIVKLKPDMAIAMGGFVSGPAGIAVWLARKPLLIHEQNAIAGYTNRILARFANTVFQAFPDTFPVVINARTVGNPIRKSIINIAPPEQRYANRQGPLRLLVVGGSRGARFINQVVLKALQQYPHLPAIEVWHQTGELDFASIEQAYSSIDIKVKVQAFIDDMLQAYEWADLLICRAGALTVSEVAAAGVASIFIPYSHAVDNHQYYNASYLSDVNAALTWEQKQFDDSILLELLERFVDNRDALKKMAMRARELAITTAAQAVANKCIQTMQQCNFLLDRKSIKRIHCIGIGGIGVSGLAEILLKRGYRVSGSDSNQTDTTDRLKALGIQVYHQHKDRQVRRADAVVYSSAIGPDNPEMQYARKHHIPIIRRGQLLAELMHLSDGIAIAGTHGKTTTTALVSHLLSDSGLDPTCVIGGILNNRNSPIHVGGLKYFVAEADESDASFLHMDPKIAVVTNIEPDHLATYDNDFECLQQSFVDFLQALPDDGLAVLCLDDPVIKKLWPKFQCHKISYGFSEGADIRMTQFHQKGLSSEFTVERQGLANITFSFNMPGKHNALNALAAIAIATHLNVSDNAIQRALAAFPGVGRRFHSHGELTVGDGKALLFDDYGHHPTEIRATLSAAREAWPDSRIVTVFQPHRYTRTRDLMPEFVESLQNTDVLLLLDVYSAGELEIPEANGAALYAAIKAHKKLNTTFIPEINDLMSVLKTTIAPGDIVLFQGAGNVGSMATKVFNGM